MARSTTYSKFDDNRFRAMSEKYLRMCSSNNEETILSHKCAGKSCTYHGNVTNSEQCPTTSWNTDIMIHHLVPFCCANSINDSVPIKKTININ